MGQDVEAGRQEPRAPETAGLAAIATALLGAAPGGALGGLAALAAAFEHAGLHAAFQSWVAQGPNLPVTGAQLTSALGADWLAALGARSGQDPVRLAAALAELLPRVVDQLTPDGRLPEGAGEPTALARGLLGR